jgi:isopropylmalate/homocitrate/citramalate synthase
VKSLNELPARATVYEVGPRDGLQNEAIPVPTDVKIRFVDLLSDASLPFIEVTSFVRPDAIPQLSDAERVVAKIARRERTKYTALVPNGRGMDRALDSKLDGIAVFAAASETFSRHNTNAGIDEVLERFRPVIARAKDSGQWVRGYVSTAFGCPYEGRVAAEAVMKVSRELATMGVDQLAISDTIGVATPRDVVTVIAGVVQEVEASSVAVHFHDTRGTALANVLAALQMGVTTFDSSAGGLGGCPYAPGAAGNLATEDLLYLLNGLDIETGVSIDGVVAASRYLAQMTGREPASRYYQAGPFIAKGAAS